MRRLAHALVPGVVGVLGVLGVLASCGAQQVEAPSPLAGEKSKSSNTVAAIRPNESSPVPDLADLSLIEVGNLNQPVDAATRAGDDAVYFVSRSGTIHRFVGEAFEPGSVFDISDLTDGSGERGLLGLAFSLDGATAYVNYTNRAGNTTIASVGVDSVGMFDRNSLRTLLTVEQPYRNHNAGDIVVEPSGMLLVPMGDGGSADDPGRVSLDDRSMLGKVLRVDPQDGSVSVLAKGLRNPWRVDLFDDRLWLADVGQNKREEISVLDRVSRRDGVPFTATGSGSTASTSNTEVVDFGWSAYEADLRFNRDQSSPNHTPPLVSYEHGENGCSVSGGAIATSGALKGRFVFADYCSGRVWSIATSERSPTMQLHFVDLDTPAAVVRAHADIYVLSLGGTIWRLNG